MFLLAQNPTTHFIVGMDCTAIKADVPAPFLLICLSAAGESTRGVHPLAEPIHPFPLCNPVVSPPPPKKAYNFALAGSSVGISRSRMSPAASLR